MSRSQFPGIVITLACLCVLAAACYPIAAPISTYSSPLGTPGLQSTQAAAVATEEAAAVPAPQTPTFTPTLAATATVTPTATATATYTVTPTIAATATATATPVQTASPAAATGSVAQPLAAAPVVRATALAPAATPQGPRKFVITEAEMQRAITSGALSQNGVDASNVQIRIANGTLSLTADRLNYGLVQLSNLAVSGRLTAKDGRLQLEADSVSPGGFVGAMIPSIANQALGQFASRWYVEQVNMGNGQIEIVIR